MEKDHPDIAAEHPGIELDAKALGSILAIEIDVVSKHLNNHYQAELAMCISSGDNSYLRYRHLYHASNKQVAKSQKWQFTGVECWARRQGPPTSQTSDLSLH